MTEERELEQLAESMRRHGCLTPIRVRPADSGDYVLIAGERRYLAAVKAGPPDRGFRARADRMCSHRAQTPVDLGNVC